MPSQAKEDHFREGREDVFSERLLEQPCEREFSFMAGVGGGGGGLLSLYPLRVVIDLAFS